MLETKNAFMHACKKRFVMEWNGMDDGALSRLSEQPALGKNGAHAAVLPMGATGTHPEQGPNQGPGQPAGGFFSAGPAPSHWSVQQQCGTLKGT